MPAPKPPFRFVLDDDASPLARAASLALGVLAHTKCANWDDLAVRIDTDPAVQKALGELRISRADADLLDRYEPVIRQLSPRPPTLTIAVCPECAPREGEGMPAGHIPAGWTLVTKTVPTGCKTTWLCTGKPKKVSAARKASVLETTDQPQPIGDELVAVGAAADSGDFPRTDQS